MLNRSKTWAVVLLVATFVAGVVVGVGGRTLWVRTAYGGGRGVERPRGVDRMTARLGAELALTAVQRDSVHAILERHWTRMSGVWETVRPRFDSMRAELDSEIMRQLTPEQQVKYRDHMTRFRHHKRMGDSGGGRR